MIEVINIQKKFNQIKEYWVPGIVGELNDHQIRLAKFKGEFCQHKHDNEDEMFLVVKGEIEIELTDKNINVSQGEFVIIPKGNVHKPIAQDEALVLMFEKSSAKNTGNIKDERTMQVIPKI